MVQKRIFIFVTDDSYTHAVLMCAPMPALLVPKEKVIGLAFEPTPFLNNDLTPAFIEYAQRHVHRYFIGDASALPPPFENGFGYMWHVPLPPRNVAKDRLMSIIVSHKQFAPGHQYRHELVRAILQTDLPIDIFGNGCSLYSSSNNDTRLKGVFEENEPYERYRFHVCIENFSIPDYTSEKYLNTIVWGTTPVYWGAHNVLFPEHTIALSGEKEKDMKLLASIVEDPERYKTPDMDQDKIRSRINFLKHLDELFV